MTQSPTFASWSSRPMRPAVEFLARSIEHAHSVGPASWVVTKDRDFVRLNVGQVAILTITAEDALVYVKMPVALGGVGTFAWAGTRSRASDYSRRAVPVPLRAVRISIGDLKRLPPQTHRAHLSAIDAAAAAKRSSPWKSALAEDVLQAIEGVLQRRLPRPGVPEPLSQRRYWVVKGRPNENDFETMLRPSQEKRWRTKRPPKSWAAGDGLFFWASSPARALVGVGEVVRVPQRRPRPGRYAHFTVRSVSDRLTRPVPQADARRVRVLASASFLKPGPSGTLFEIDGTQAAALLHLIQDRNPGVDPHWPEVGASELATNTIPQIDAAASSPEGLRQLVAHYRYERDRRIVERKRHDYRHRHGHLGCQICGFDFKATYGTIGESFCEVHHLKPLSSRTRASVTALKELAVVCSNCHRMIHSRQRPFGIQALKHALIAARPSATRSLRS